MKVLGFIGLGFITFVLTVLGAMALTGNLNRESIDRLLNRQEQEAPVKKQADDLDPFLRSLNKEREAVKKREERVRLAEDALDLRERQNQDLLAEIDEKLTQLQEAMTEADDEREQRLKDDAKSLAEMSEKKAAETLNELPIEDATQILRYMKEKPRGKILDEMEPRKAALLLSSTQATVY